MNFDIEPLSLLRGSSDGSERRAAFARDNLLTIREVAAFLRLTRWTLGWWRSRGEGPRFIKMGRLVRYRRADLQAWLRKQAVDPERAKTRSGVQ